MDEVAIHYLTDFIQAYDFAGQQRSATKVKAYVERFYEQTGAAREQQKKEQQKWRLLHPPTTSPLT